MNARLLGLYVPKGKGPGRLMLMMLVCWALSAKGPGQLMLMMLAQLRLTWQGPKRLMLMMLAWRSPVGLCLPKG